MYINEKSTTCKLCGRPAKEIESSRFETVYECPVCHRYRFAPNFLLYTDERREILKNYFQSLDEFDEKRNTLIVNEEIFQNIVDKKI